MEHEKQQKHFLKLLESNPPRIANGELFYTLPATEVLKIVKSPIAPERKEHEVTPANGNNSGKQDAQPLKKRGRGRPRNSERKAA